jgi:hypothetical protein
MNNFKLWNEDPPARLAGIRKIHACPATETKDGGKKEARPDLNPLPQGEDFHLVRAWVRERLSPNPAASLASDVATTSPSPGGEGRGEDGLSFLPYSNSTVLRSRRCIQAIGGQPIVAALPFHPLQTLCQFCAYPLRVGSGRLLFDLQCELASTQLAFANSFGVLAKERRAA